MVTITLPKIEYLKIKKEANAYRLIKTHLFESLVQDPVDKVVRDFRKTKIYSEAFLQDLEKGLRRSSYGK
ncbi:MAG: hypothetical protein WAN61_00580 [Minisyncoccia bacterium]